MCQEGLTPGGRRAAGQGGDPGGLSVLWAAEASLQGGPESALGETGERSGLASHSGYRSHFCRE